MLMYRYAEIPSVVFLSAHSWVGHTRFFGAQKSEEVCPVHKQSRRGYGEVLFWRFCDFPLETCRVTLTGFNSLERWWFKSGGMVYWVEVYCLVTPLWFKRHDFWYQCYSSEHKSYQMWKPEGPFLATVFKYCTRVAYIFVPSVDNIFRGILYPFYFLGKVLS